MTKYLAASFLGTLAAGALIVGVTKFIGPIPLSISQTTMNKQSSFDVSGTGEITTAPDRAVVSVGVQVTDDTVTKVQDKGNLIIKKVTQDIQKLGIDAGDIKTTNYSLYPTYDYRSGTQRITGYTLSVTVNVTIKDFSNINQVVDTATADGANQVGGVSFTLSEAKQLDVENQAREQAVKHAKEKADSLARISGIKLGKIINVMENGNNPIPRPMVYFDKAQANSAPMAGGLGAGAPTDVQPGSTTFTMTVTLSYETL